jgi:small-conductance mechanosensitive channel
VLVLVLVWAQLVFAALPLTRGFARAGLEYLLDPLVILWKGFLANIGDIFFVLVVLALAFYGLRGTRWLLGEVAQGRVILPGVTPHWALPLYKVLRLAVVAITVVIVYPYIPGSSSEAFKGVSLFVGALFTLGASGAAGNFIGGLALVFTNSYQVGDRIKVGEVTGDVLETTLLLTRLRTIKNEVVTLPNAALMGGALVNYSALARGQGLILHTTVTIGYNTPWRKVHELLVQAALRTARLEREPAPYVLQTGLGDFYVRYELNAYTRHPEAMGTIYGELHQNIQDCFNEAGVEIMSPNYTSLRDGRGTTIPGGAPPASPAPDGTP